MPAAERLDFLKAPPGFQVADLPAHLQRTIETAGVWGPNALSVAWAKYKAENDPPGLPLFSSGRVMEWYGGAAEARAAAWAWYERRLDLAVKLERLADFMLSIGTHTNFNPWPRGLTWTDEQVAGVERWLVGRGKLPEVLRG